MKKITKIEPQKKRRGRYNIYLDDEFALGIDENTLIGHRLHKGMEVSDEFWSDIIHSEELNKGLNYALNLLSFRNRSEKEVTLKMKQHGYDAETIQYALSKLKEYGYLDDRQFASQWVSSQQKSKLAGKNLVRQELFQKGVPKEIIDQTLSEQVNEADELERAREVARKKWNSISRGDRQSQYRKLTGLFGRKGYSYSVVSTVAREFLNSVDDESFIYDD